MSDIQRSSVTKKQGRSKNKHLPYQRKKRNQSVKEYLYQRMNGKCSYCHDNFKLKDLCLIKKNHQWNSLFEPIHNKVIACKKCSYKKSEMNHKEFIRYLRRERWKLRDEISENYREISSKVFNRYENKCIYCEFEFGYTPKKRKKQLTLDHKRSLLCHGDNDEKNLASSCYIHNIEKDSRSSEQYFKYLRDSGRKFKPKSIIPK
ncbi:hypothetical protein U8V72_18395 [Priestia filamentosa]|uniref:hypothetical protein n=1 Tax=Priestia filamentosa TaxID=1402861 RepID=UPI0005893F86